MVGHVGRINAHKEPVRPVELLIDGDLLSLVKMLVGLVRGGRVREAVKIGNDIAVEAADFGRRRVGSDVVDARREHAGACPVWHPIIRDLHRFFIAIARVIVNDNGKGGTAPDPLVLCSGAKDKRWRVLDAVRDFSMLPGQRLWVGCWFKWPDIFITADDVGRWLFSVGALVKVAAFLGSLSWPSEVSDMGSGGISFVELLFCMKGGLVKDFVLRNIFRNTGGLGAEFWCQLHPCALMLIFGSFADTLAICFEP